MDREHAATAVPGKVTSRYHPFPIGCVSGKTKIGRLAVAAQNWKRRPTVGPMFWELRNPLACPPVTCDHITPA